MNFFKASLSISNIVVGFFFNYISICIYFYIHFTSNFSLFSYKRIFISIYFSSHKKVSHYYLRLSFHIKKKFDTSLICVLNFFRTQLNFMFIKESYWVTDLRILWGFFNFSFSFNFMFIFVFILVDGAFSKRDKNDVWIIFCRWYYKTSK